MISRRFSAIAIGAAAWALAATGALAQSIVSAKSGAVHHVEGRVLIDGKVVESKIAEFPNLNEGSVLRTERGRAEMLLTPGVIVRLGENSAVRMISNRLSDTRLEMVEGSALVEVMEMLKENAVSFTSKDASIQLLDKGLYRMDMIRAASCIRGQGRGEDRRSDFGCQERQAGRPRRAGVSRYEVRQQERRLTLPLELSALQLSVDGEPLGS